MQSIARTALYCDSDWQVMLGAIFIGQDAYSLPTRGTLLMLAQPQTPLLSGQLKLHGSHSLDVEQRTVLDFGGLSVVTVVTADDVRVLNRLPQPSFERAGAIQCRRNAQLLSTRLQNCERHCRPD